MKLAMLSLLCCGFLGAQDLSLFIHDNTGATADKPLGSTYQFPDTPEGSSSDLSLKAVNSSSYTVFLGNIYVGDESGSAVLSTNFSITGMNQSATIAPGAATYFVAHFVPITTGNISGYLQASYLVQKNGCVIGSTNASTQCPKMVSTFSMLTGHASDPLMVLSYSVNGNSITLQPNSANWLDFGKVSTSSNQTITFTLSNQTAGAVMIPAISVVNTIYASSAFSLDISGLPATLGPNSSATFRVTFAPGQTGLSTATLMVGSLPFGIQGTGVILAGIDVLEIFYVDQDGVRTLPQAATPISLGQVTAGTGAGSTLTFTVTNPVSSLNAVSVSGINVSGSGYSVSSLPSFPASIQPGTSITFAVTFTASAAGTFTGSLSIGARQFALTAVSTTSPVPAPAFSVSQTPLVSQQQVNLTIQLASASTVAAIGTLTMAFVPSVSGVSDDPAILFTATGSRQLQVNVAAGGQTATYNGQAALTFQTGTTAGKITFTLVFPNGAPYSQSFTISPAAIGISSASAVRKAPNLVVTVTGYDNTYSAGQMSFTFYDTSGKVLTPSAMSVDATSAFHQYFFTSNQAGGAFSAQASFPVNGDTSQVGSVALKMTNSAGTASTTQTFQ